MSMVQYDAFDETATDETKDDYEGFAAYNNNSTDGLVS